MPIHLDVLARLHVMLGGLAALAGTSLMVLAGGTRLALRELGNVDLIEGPAPANATGPVGVWILLWCGVIITAGGVALIVTGRALARRQRAGRVVALVLAVPNLLVVPFGTALSIYSYWVLLNDEARRAFGRPPRSTRRHPELERQSHDAYD